MAVPDARGGRKDVDGCCRAERFRYPMRAGKECFEALVPKPEPTVLGAPEDGCSESPSELPLNEEFHAGSPVVVELRVRLSILPNGHGQRVAGHPGA